MVNSLNMWLKAVHTLEHFFGKYPELLKLVENLSDQDIENLRLGGHDPVKVYAAYSEAVNHKGSPTVILARTIKGYGLGEAGEGRNITHNQKLNQDELLYFRDRFMSHLPIKRLLQPPSIGFQKIQRSINI